MRALQTPDLSLATLSGARVVAGSNALPQLVRTSRFAEAEIEWQGARWLLSMPLTSAAIPRIEPAASRLRRLTTPGMHEYRILSQEMRWYDAAGAEQRTDLVLERLPEGVGFARALAAVPAQALHAALDRLQEELREAGVAHNNLCETNLRWSDGRLVALRYHDATIGSAGEADAAAFEELHRRIDSAAESAAQTVGDVVAGYTASQPLTGHLWTGNFFEGLACVEDETGYGFVDARNRTVIPARFVWAGDFHEGRAEVETPTGMGLIDREGRYVIAPEYEIVEYDFVRSVAYVRRDGLWAQFDYSGRRTTGFSAAARPRSEAGQNVSEAENE